MRPFHWGIGDQPFFLYFAHTFPHIPLAASPRFRGKSPLGLCGDTIEEVDWSIGEVLAALKAQGLERSTLAKFSSDNGPWYEGSPGRLRGRKGFTLEGGVRVPFITRMMGRIRRGRVSHQLASMMDVLPTASKLCNASPPEKPLDGIDLWPVPDGKTENIDREALLYFAEQGDLQCDRWRNFKLHLTRHSILRSRAGVGAEEYSTCEARTVRSVPGRRRVVRCRRQVPGCRSRPTGAGGTADDRDAGRDTTTLARHTGPQDTRGAAGAWPPALE